MTPDAVTIAAPQIELKSDIDVDLVDSMGGDKRTAQAARVSVIGDKAEEEELTQQKIDGLIGYLMKNRHGTPFEHTVFTFSIRAPIFIFREWHRHRIASISEESARYRKMRPVFYIPPPGRPLMQVGKPGAYTYAPGDEAQYAKFVKDCMEAFFYSWKAYESSLDSQVAREMSRITLPVALYSSMYWTVNARSLMNLLSLRTIDERARVKSTPMIEFHHAAKKLEEHFGKVAPLVLKAFNENGRVAP